MTNKQIEEVPREYGYMDKDTKEGLSFTEEGWEKEFHKYFRGFKYDEAMWPLKDFIRTLLTQRDAELRKVIEGKKEFFQKATNGTTDSSLYAKAVVATCNDILSHLTQPSNTELIQITKEELEENREIIERIPLESESNNEKENITNTNK